MADQENTTDVKPTAEQVAADEAVAKEEFKAAFNKTAGKGKQTKANASDAASTDGDEEEVITKKDDEENVEKTPAAKAETAKPAATTEDADKEWEGVHPAMRKRLEGFDQLTTRVRNTEGHIGNLNSTLKQLTTAGKTAATAAGAAAPTTAQVEAAITNTKEWEKLKEEYPDWADGIEKQMAVMEKRILQKTSNVDASAIREDAVKSANETTRATVAEMREAIRVDIKHPGWEDTVKTEEFSKWLAVQPLDTQTLAASDKSGDAIKLLDRFTDFKAAQAAAPATPANDKDGRRKQQERLAKATTPKGGTQAPVVGASDNDAFNKGFKRIQKSNRV